MNSRLFRAITPLILVPAAFAQSNQVPKAPAVPITMSPADKKVAEKTLRRVKKGFGLSRMFLTFTNLEEKYIAPLTVSSKVSLNELFQQTQQIMLSGNSVNEFPPVSVGQNVRVYLEGDTTLGLTCTRSETSISCTNPVFGYRIR
jgi:hypothetical protein